MHKRCHHINKMFIAQRLILSHRGADVLCGFFVFSACDLFPGSKHQGKFQLLLKGTFSGFMVINAPDVFSSAPAGFLLSFVSQGQIKALGCSRPGEVRHLLAILQLLRLNLSNLLKHNINLTIREAFSTFIWSSGEGHLFFLDHSFDF